MILFTITLYFIYDCLIYFISNILSVFNRKDSGYVIKTELGRKNLRRFSFQEFKEKLNENRIN